MASLNNHTYEELKNRVEEAMFKEDFQERYFTLLCHPDQCVNQIRDFTNTRLRLQHTEE